MTTITTTKKRGLLGILFSLALALAMAPALCEEALAYEGGPYDGLVNKTTPVYFNGRSWTIIEDNSTAVDAGTVTLLAADTSFGLSTAYRAFSSRTASRAGSVIGSVIGSVAGSLTGSHTFPGLLAVKRVPTRRPSTTS